MGPLEGVVVLDLTEGLCGPFASMRLADLGADVWKVEPLLGDCSRRMGPPWVGDESAVYLTLNRGKRSLAVDLERPEGAELVRRLAARADAVLEDLGPGRAEQLGIGFGRLRAANADLVYVAISAWGEKGPLADQPGCELAVQAMADYTNSLGRIGEAPVRLGADVANLSTGVFAAQAVLAGLLHRARRGEGERASVSMLGTLLHMRGIMWTALSDPDDWFGFHLDNYTKPPETGYRTKDGRVFFGLRRGTSEDWDTLMITLGLEDHIADPRFERFGREATMLGRHAAEVKHVWEKGFAQLTCEEVVDLVHEYRGDAVMFTDYPTLVNHGQTAALGSFTEIEHPRLGALPTVAPAARLSDTPLRITLPPPELGEHTDEVLASIGVTPDALRELRAAGVVG
ncbi:MAG: CaiB/BaiF CoA transferase family protein [Acidimicrobiales bacterium]